jgi:NAD(P)H-nitrite reductase large subunit/nitrite reductase/ring-hydroxylating ferredoxin subunit
MANGNWNDVASSDDIEQGSLFAAALSEEEQVFITRSEAGLVAFSDVCPHVGCPLSWGHVRGDQVTCACHNARFDLSSGRATTAPSLDDLAHYEVREEAGRVYIGERHDPSFPEMPQSDDRSVVIVGAGAGGNAAAEQLRREGFSGRITMITPENHLPYDRTLLSKFFLAGGMGASDVVLRSGDFYEQAGIEVRTGCRVTAVAPADKRITLDDGTDLQADHLILATGSRAKTLPIPGNNLPGVFTLRTVADAEAIDRAAAEAQNVVVIGASFIGTETAAYLTGRGLHVTVVAPERTPFENILGEAVGNRFRVLHESQGVSLRMGNTVSSIKGSGSVRSVELADGTSLPADLVILGVGVEPVVDYIRDSGLVEDGAVPVNERLETKTPGVYAIGDLARVHGETGAKRVEHWVVAQRHGQQAAKSITGADHGLQYAPFFWTMQFEMPFAYVGYAPDYDEVKYKGSVDDNDFVAGYFKRGRLEAVGTIGRPEAAIRYGYLLDEGRRIGPDEFEGDLSALGV